MALYTYDCDPIISGTLRKVLVASWGNFVSVRVTETQLQVGRVRLFLDCKQYHLESNEGWLVRIVKKHSQIDVDLLLVTLWNLLWEEPCHYSETLLLKNLKYWTTRML